MVKPFIQQTPSFENFRQEIERLKATSNDPDVKFPEFSSGGRTYVLVSGKPIALCQNISYQISVSPKETRTIDTNLPWDIYATQMSINANLSQIVDPRNSAEAQSLFSTMASSIHQPLVELEVFDRAGSRLFFARGMFYDVSMSIGTSSMSVRSARFQGVAYSANVAQDFKPYPSEEAIRGKLDKFAKDLASKLKPFGL